MAVAASVDPELERSCDRVRHCLEWTQQRSRRVVVVAHSQGGFIAHSLLSETARHPASTVATLIGVGSGLKPIWLLRQLNDRSVGLLAWVAIGIVALVEAIVLPLLGGAISTLGALTRGTIEIGGFLAVPLAGENAGQLQQSIQHGLDIQLLALTGNWAALGQLGPLQGAMAMLLFVGIVCGRRLGARAYPDPDAVGLAKVSARHWIEMSSYHDPVGRMLLPKLPDPAEEYAIAVGGHPIRDHVAYFSPASILPWQVAGCVLSELRLPHSPQIASVDRSLLALAARRRRLRAGFLATVIVVGALPIILTRRSLVLAGADMAILLAAIVISSVLLNLRETAAHRRVLADLRTAVSRGAPPDDLLQPVSLENRIFPTLLLLLLVVICFVTALFLSRYPDDQSRSGGPLMLLVLVALADLLVVGAGYRARRFFLVAGVALCWQSHLATVPAVAHDASVPDVFATLGVLALVVASALCVALFVLLDPKRLR